MSDKEKKKFITEKRVLIGVSILSIVVIFCVDTLFYDNTMNVTVLIFLSVFHYFHYKNSYKQNKKWAYFIYLIAFAVIFYLTLPSMTEPHARKQIEEVYDVTILDQYQAQTDPTKWHFFKSNNALIYETRTTDGEFERYFVNLEDALIIKMDE